MEDHKLKLFLVKTKGVGDFYVVEKSYNDAEKKISILLSRAEYGYSSHRLVDEIKLLSLELSEFPKGRPNFSSDNSKLILPTTCNNLENKKGE